MIDRPGRRRCLRPPPAASPRRQGRCFPHRCRKRLLLGGTCVKTPCKRRCRISRRGGYDQSRDAPSFALRHGIRSDPGRGIHPRTGGKSGSPRHSFPAIRASSRCSSRSGCCPGTSRRNADTRGRRPCRSAGDVLLRIDPARYESQLVALPAQLELQQLRFAQMTPTAKKPEPRDLPRGPAAAGDPELHQSALRKREPRIHRSSPRRRDPDCRCPGFPLRGN
jgi:hypothetical protein